MKDCFLEQFFVNRRSSDEKHLQEGLKSKSDLGSAKWDFSALKSEPLCHIFFLPVCFTGCLHILSALLSQECSNGRSMNIIKMIMRAPNHERLMAELYLHFHGISSRWNDLRSSCGCMRFLSHRMSCFRSPLANPWCLEWPPILINLCP